MAKKKHKRQGNMLESNCDCSSEMDPCEDSSWVIVKKQRITILVPPLPATERPTEPKSAPSQVQAILGRSVSEKSQLPAEACPVMPSINESKNPTSFPLKKNIFTEEVSSPQRLVSLPKSLGLGSQMQSKSSSKPSIRKFHRESETSNASKYIEQAKLTNIPCNFPGGVTILHQQLKARNLEKKLQKAGGLSSWLTSLGLEQFVRIFKCRRLNEFQLASLTMKKLKDMGTLAVGPRRKLINAIDCVCNPHYLRDFKN